MCSGNVICTSAACNVEKYTNPVSQAASSTGLLYVQITVLYLLTVQSKESVAGDWIVASE